ncbi:MAG: hypothetical protein ABJG78_12385 [Cyclobacteriaceae bacterium]
MIKSIFRLTVLTLFFLSCEPDNERVNQLDKEGNKIGLWVEVDAKGDTIKREVYDSLSNPIQKEVMTEGGSKVMMLYTNGELSKLINYFGNGNIESETEYKGDIQEGSQIIYFENGKISIESNYVDNLPVGKYFKYYPNGQINIKSDTIGNGRFWMYDSLGDLSKVYIQENFKVIDSLDISTFQ